MEFKDRLKKYRTQKGFTQDGLANKIFVSRSAVAKWEAGLGLPSADSEQALCKVLGINREDLFPNKEAESLLIQKNMKIKTRMIISIVLAVVLTISLVLIAFLVASSYLTAKEIFSKTPTVTRIFFDSKRNDGDNGVDFYNGQYFVYKNTSSYVYAEVTVDARLDISNLQIKFDGTDCFACRVSGSQTNGNERTYWYKVPFFARENISELKITSATYSFYDGSDANKYKTKNCKVIAQPIPIIFSNTNMANVTFKFNARTVIDFCIEKGESVNNAILSLGKHEYLLEHLMNTNYSYLLNKLSFVGWERADGVSLYEPVYEDIIVNACTELKPNVTFDVSASDLQMLVFKTAKPSFLLDGDSYDNLFFTLKEQSENIEIIENNIIKAIKPGVATVTADYDLGFYSGSLQFEVTVLEEVFVDVFGYRKYITPGSYYTGIKTVYDYQTGGAKLTDTALQELTDYFNKQNQDFLLKTGKERKLVELRWVSNTLIVPVFETEHVFDLSELDVKVFIGHSGTLINNIQPITVTVDEVTQVYFQYSPPELLEVEIKSYYTQNGNYLPEDCIFANMENLTMCVEICVIENGVYYYLPTYHIPITVIDD